MEKRYEIRPEIKITLTQEDIDDIMCTALEGGVTACWCGEAEVVGEYLGEYGHEQISRGGVLRMHDAEEDAAYELTLKKFLNGVKLWIEKGYVHDGVIVDGDGSEKEVDCGCIDALDADCIVQLGLFGELVYG